MKLLLGLMLLVASLNTGAQSIKVSIYNDYTVTSFVLSVVKGTCQINDNEKTFFTLNENENLYVSLVGNMISLHGKGIKNRQFPSLHFVPDSSAVLQIRPVNPLADARRYQNEITVSVDFNRLLMIHHLNFNDYLAGVVEAEGGPSSFIEYYKAQTLLCRTYAIDNRNRHIEEGFHLCDGTHCQAYKGMATSNRLIKKAVQATENLVVVDSNGMLITAAYHSNSGGHTEDALDVWLQDMPYLKAFHDPYSMKGRNINWEKKINRKDWETYLLKNGLQLPSGSYSYHNQFRERNYIIENFSIPYYRLRKDWDLRSSFFTVIDDGSTIRLKGKGYGHGVGMSQEGAMEMARQGHTFQEILNFYFKNVAIERLQNVTHN